MCIIELRLQSFSGTFSGVYSGNWNTGLNNQGNEANYWSSTAYSSTTNARNLYFDTDGNINPGTNNNNKFNGFAVRCVVAP